MSPEASVEVVNGPQRPNISFNGRLLYSDTSTPEKRVESLPSAPQALYIVISPLFFYGVNELSEKIPENSRVIAIEHDSGLYELGNDIFKRNFSGSVEFVHITPENLNSVVRSLSAYRARRVVPVKLNMGYMLFRKFYDSFLETLESSISTFWKNRMTTIHMGRLWCRNIFLNLPVLRNARLLNELRTDKPVICAGAGESLEHSISFILENRSRFFIIAADTAVSTLLLNGISPDLTVVVEAQHANLFDFYCEKALELPVAADLTSAPELLRKLRGPLYFFISRFEDSEIFNSLKTFSLLPQIIPPLGSVGITAVMISSMISRNKIFYTGLDFSFKPEKYHSSGSPSHIFSMLTETREFRQGFYSSAFSNSRFRENDKTDRLVYTDLVMKSYLETLSNFISSSERFHDIGITGLAADRPVLTHRHALELASGTSEIMPVHYSQEEPAGFTSDRIRAFISSELENIEKALDSVISFQNSRSGGDLIDPELHALLRHLDYTWLFFPDNTPLPCSDASFLKRFLFSASWFKKQLRNALRLL